MLLGTDVTVMDHIVELDGLSIHSDSPLHTEYDRVMPVFSDESELLCRAIERGVRGDVLDVGTGSGILALYALRKGAHSVVGTDINPKAIAFADRNARRNRMSAQSGFLVGDLYEPAVGRKFDFVIVNPPFVPLPPEYRMFLSADGGPDGMAVVRRILDRVKEHLAPGGVFLMLTMSLGDGNEPLVFRLLRDAFRGHRARIVSTHIYQGRNVDAEEYFRFFSIVPAYAQWRQFLEKRSLTHLYYMLHEVRPHRQFDHVERRNEVPLEQTEFSGSWAGRLNRFRGWLAGKAKG